MSYGWTGTTLRVNLTTGAIIKEATDTAWMGGTGYGYKVLWDEVSRETGPFDEENKIVIGAGPLTGTGAPSGGRSSITTIFPPVFQYHLVGSGHFGGHFGAELKFAGYDNIIIEGKSASPVWLRIEDDQVSLEDASGVWGKGIYQATRQINEIMGKEAVVAAIGQAGENQARMANIMNSLSHSAGGVGGVFGSKRLKAIGIIGTQAVKIAADMDLWRDTVRYALTLIGGNNQNVLPQNAQGWNEYSSRSSRWSAQDGKYWGAAEYPVNTGICPPGDINRIGYRTHKAGDVSQTYGEQMLVRQEGCHSCPIRCHSAVVWPGMQEKYGVSDTAVNTCIGWMGPKNLVNDYPDEVTKVEATILGKHMADDYGTWCGYQLLQRTFNYAVKNGYVESFLADAEYASIPWDLYTAGDPNFLKDIYRRMAYKEGDLGRLMAEGPAYMAQEMGFFQSFATSRTFDTWNPAIGNGYHHSGAMVGDLINMQYNRDPQCHSHVIARWGGLPQNIRESIFMETFGSTAGLDLEDPIQASPEKSAFAVWCIARKELHNSLTLCNWMYPWVQSPLKERGYKGDTALESKYYSLATGVDISEGDLDHEGKKFFTLHRALTVRGMNTIDMRGMHDVLPPWRSSSGSSYSDQVVDGLTYFYRELGWNETNGVPTRAGLEDYGLDAVADGLEQMDLLG